MAVVPIVTYDDPVLRKKTREVPENSQELQEMIDDMFDTMYNADGVGLAAPQIGRTLRVFIVDADSMIEEEDRQPGSLTFINPEIRSTGDETVQLEEGCLSIPEVTGPVTRPRQVTLSYFDREFNEQILQTDGWLSRVIQHEYDHLEGILFLDHLSMFKRKLLGSKLREIDEGTKEIDYPVKPKKAVS